MALHTMSPESGTPYWSEVPRKSFEKHRGMRHGDQGLQDKGRDSRRRLRGGTEEEETESEG